MYDVIFVQKDEVLSDTKTGDSVLFSIIKWRFSLIVV